MSLSAIVYLCLLLPICAQIQLRQLQTEVGRTRTNIDKLEMQYLATWVLGCVFLLLSGWHLQVRDNWEMPLAVFTRELVIVGPLTYSLWSIHHHFSWFRNVADPNLDASDRPSLKVINKILGLAVLATLLFVLLECISKPNHSNQTGWIWMIGTLFLLLENFPVIVSKWLRLKPYANTSLENALQLICESERTRVPQVLLWKTDGTIVNALMLGLFPWNRRLILTDGLLDSMDDNQLRAILRHEIAHVKHGHVFWRLFVVSAPLVPIFAFNHLTARGLSQSSMGFAHHLNTNEIMWLVVLFYFIYVYFFFGWQARLMEHEADLFAFGFGRPNLDQQSSYRGNQAHTIEALRSLAREYPQMFAANRWLYPSLADRITLLQRVGTHPNLSDRVRHQLLWARCVILVGCGISLIGLLAASAILAR
ncbi:MAG TPA: M48 family metalloprotease [Pirellulaceae bacterium]|nr:M48 family metalloprotease [Pirellulaceae bacterium]HMO91502.1 M48 family metalloprotease [Pirellulaceae bacterium]HMP70975.1 M48 family metalloprotease [Pirellulaceae bacterium]